MDVLHGISVSDPYRWLEDQDDPRTREWLDAQTRYARAYLDGIPGRDRLRKRVQEFLNVETYDCLQKRGKRYFFRKRLAAEQQPSIYMREGSDGEDQLLIDPSKRGTGTHTAVKPLHVSPNGQLLLYEVKEGGERTGTFEVFDVESRQTLPDVLSRGYLRGFAFAPDSQSFYYVHESTQAERLLPNAAYQHALGAAFHKDREVFRVGGSEKLRLSLVCDGERLGFLVYRFLETLHTDFYVKALQPGSTLETIVRNADYVFGPVLVAGRVFAITDRGAPNLRIVEVRPCPGAEPEWMEIIPETDVRIHEWRVVGERIFVSYIRQRMTRLSIFDFSGREAARIPVSVDETVRFNGCSPDELFIESESFTKPITVYRLSPETGKPVLWATRKIPFGATNFRDTQVWYTAKDGTRIPMFLVGNSEAISGGVRPTIMTSYGGFGVSMTPQFSALVALLIERGCLFALPGIRGGSEFGVAWHQAAKRRNRQTAYDDFLSAAEWLIKVGRTSPGRLAIFGGSNSGLLVGAAMTQRPDLFRAVLCMVPMLDMLRYHLFDNANVWRDEFGTAEDADDFHALARYSPYHQVRDGVRYPATMIVSGDADQNCNPLHARKMTARLQAANLSEHPIFLDYDKYRGHSPVLPLAARIEALTDRVAFLCDQLQLHL